MLDQLAGVLVPAAVAFLIALATLYVSRKAGLSDIDAAVDVQRGMLVSTLKTRVELLEQENARQKAEIERLERENDDLRRRVDRLERALADRVMSNG